MADVDLQATCREAWRQVVIPKSLTEEYGEIGWLDSDGFALRMRFQTGLFNDSYVGWIAAQDSRYAVGLGFSGLFFRELSVDRLREALQAVADQWCDLCQPYEKGGLLPQPRRIICVATDEGVRFPRQPALMNWCISSKEPYNVVYSYDRSKYRLERIAESCTESVEAFALVRK